MENTRLCAIKLSLGPLYYYWPRQEVLDFYEKIQKAPVDIVYLGETVCTRRHELDLDDYLNIAARLLESGKEVVLSSQVLLESESDLRRLRHLLAAGVTIEANDMSAVNLLTKAGPAPFVAGMTLNVYNPDTLTLMQQVGARRWVAPVEMSGRQLQMMTAGRDGAIETEVLAYGRLPLAYSSRCFTARHFKLQKDGCEFRCLDYPDGLEMRTREGEPFLVINGIQTQSVKVCDLLGDMAALAACGVDILRISPQHASTLEIIQLFHDVRTAERSATESFARAGTLRVAPPCNGYFHQRPGLDLVSSTTLEAPN